MPIDFFSVVKIFHLAAMAVWMAGGITVAGDIRRSLALGAAHCAPMVQRVNIAERIGTTSGMLTAVSGIVLVFSSGGFTAVPFRIHIGLALTIITFFIGALFASPTWRRIAGIIERNADLTEAKFLANRFAVSMMIEHVLRAAILVLMVIRF